MFPQFDPSKMDPKVLMELSQLIQQLPAEKLTKMQSIMHNMMAGHDVRKDMEEFEKTLPPGFRERIAELMMSQASSGAFSSGLDRETPGTQEVQAEIEAPAGATTQDTNPVREARLTILRAVANGIMSPEEAEKLL